MLKGLVAAGLMAVSSVAMALDVQVDGSAKHQTIEGFGTCLISWVPRMAEYYPHARAGADLRRRPPLQFPALQSLGRRHHRQGR